MERLIKRAANLLSVKSIVTLVLTLVFAYLAVVGRVTGQDLLTIFLMVVSFYFGTQSQKIQEAMDSHAEQQGD